ncbi:MAG: hypothetical protein Q8P93_02750 [bacterium]|nr:hypothetical protein [bacterium]
MKTLRWILVLPAAAVLPTAIIMLLDLMMFFTGLVDSRWSFSSEKSFLGLIVEYAFFAAFFVFVGVVTAPAHKKTVAMVLASIFYLYLGLQLFIVIFDSDLIVISGALTPVIYGFASVVAASFAVRAVFRDEDLSFLTSMSHEE